MEAGDTDYVVVVQCAQVTGQTCPGFLCEYAFTNRIDAFTSYPRDKHIRYISVGCGGCPGLATQRKLTNIKTNLKKRESRGIDTVAVHLSSCITRSNHHGPRCPHIDIIKEQVRRAGFGECIEDSRISTTAEKRRASGMYQD